MRIKDKNKPQTVKIEQALKSLEIATKSYLKVREEQLADLAIQSSQTLIKELVRDKAETDVYIDSLRGGVK